MYFCSFFVLFCFNVQKYYHCSLFRSFVVILFVFSCDFKGIENHSYWLWYKSWLWIMCIHYTTLKINSLPMCFSNKRGQKQVWLLSNFTQARVPPKKSVSHHLDVAFQCPYCRWWCNTERMSLLNSVKSSHSGARCKLWDRGWFLS